ncbi:hypothetical protein [Hymenobacter telluris]|nr:hypothetical protein [Hymenobacter telluris]
MATSTDGCMGQLQGRLGAGLMLSGSHPHRPRTGDGGVVLR